MRSFLPSIMTSLDPQEIEMRELARHEMRESRRRRTAARDPHGAAKPPWPVKDAGEDESPVYTIERDPKTGRAKFTEHRIIGNVKMVGASARSRFVLEVTDGTFVHGELVSPGDTVECFSGTAAELIGSGRVRVITEIRPS